MNWQKKTRRKQREMKKRKPVKKKIFHDFHFLQQPPHVVLHRRPPIGCLRYRWFGAGKLRPTSSAGPHE